MTLISLGVTFVLLKLTIGPITHELDPAGGCALQLPSQFAKHTGEFIFMSDRRQHAIINIDGADVTLDLVKSDRSTYFYTASDLDVQVEYNLPNSDAVLTIKRGKAKKTVAAKAVCQAN